MDRAVSTVLDVALCLLLIGVAVGTIVTAVPDDSRTVTVDSDRVTNSILMETATISTGETRTAHGTLTNHLVRATVLDATLDSDRLTESQYPENVRQTIDQRTKNRVHITARWEPYSESTVESSLTIGPRPPANAETAATRWTFDSGMKTANSLDSFGSFATAIAEVYIDRVFPPERTRIRLVDPRTTTMARARYRHAARVVGTDVENATIEGQSHRANERLVSALEGRIESDLRAKYEDIDSVHTEPGVGDVEIVVRRWEP